MLVPFALLSIWTASFANASCSWPSTATSPVKGPSIPIVALQALVELLLPLLAAALLVLLLLLLLLPQPAATSAATARTAAMIHPFLTARTSSSSSRMTFRCVVRGSR